MPDADYPRLIEFAFPLKQASLDSVHEKNVRHGHISTLHIWPARRPLAACRAALIATLLPDPGTSEGRRLLCEKIAGKVVKKIEKKKMPGGQIVEREKEETEGGILHWGRETENAETLEWFRQEIRKAYGGRAPKVLDPFAGGGAIPLEAMRLGCEATAIDINPVAWFILKCTLEYPQKLAGNTYPLPSFILKNREFMESFLRRAQGMSKAEIAKQLKNLGLGDAVGQETFLPAQFEADLAWHVRAWGQWVLDQARRDLARFYPIYADFEPLEEGKVYEWRPMRLVPPKDDGTPDIDSLNARFGEDYLKVRTNPRWIAKPTVAYLWARTVTCKNCRATIPLLKTRWLSKKDTKRVLAQPVPAAQGGIEFRLMHHAPVVGGNTAQKREHDRRIGAGTMSRAGAKCLHCETIQTHEDIQVAATCGNWSSMIVAVVVDGPIGKEYREVTQAEVQAFARSTEREFPPLTEPISPIRPSPNAIGLSGLTRYGITSFGRAFNGRQVSSMQAFVEATRAAMPVLRSIYDETVTQAVFAYLSAALDRLTDRNSTLCHWNKDYEKITGTFQRYALRVNWDYAEVNPFAPTTGNYRDAVEWIAEFIDHAIRVASDSSSACVLQASATAVPLQDSIVDLILTDPPYYDAIPYADLSDYYYVWLKRTVGDLFPKAFEAETTPKHGELVQHAARADGDNRAAKERYEKGMAEAFTQFNRCLSRDGRFVVVFAHKQPDAWETLVSAIIRTGFAVDASWPIQTEMPHKAAGGARLASSVWLVCKKRLESARPGWDNKVLEEMRVHITQRLHDFWDAGIRGPDFVWAATGPALEAYSKHPVVKKADDPGHVLTVSEFLSHVRRMVVDFVVGRVLGSDGAAETRVDRLDEPTAYYLLHRHDFGLAEAPVGACILYATACGLSDQGLVRDWDMLVKTGSDQATNDEEIDEEVDAEEEPAEYTGSGSKVKLKPWNQRRGRSMGYEAPGGRPVPLIDRIHRLMHLWKGGDVHKVDEYLDEHGLRRHELFRRVLQSLIELSKPGSEERSLLESLSNHIGAKGAKKKEHSLFPEMAAMPQEDV
jgi:adenine-specific DNA methylase